MYHVLCWRVYSYNSILQAGLRNSWAQGPHGKSGLQIVPVAPHSQRPHAGAYLKEHHLDAARGGGGGHCEHGGVHDGRGV